MGAYGTVVWLDRKGVEHEQGIYYHPGETWGETIATVETMLRLRWGSDIFKKVLFFNGNAA